jgi:hypothetical protein
MDDSENICLSCGLCCDGTLIGFVQLEKEELPRLRKVMEIEGTENNAFLLHPCKKYCNGCTVYADRPTQCSKFNCGLLTAVEKHSIPFEKALTCIEEVNSLKIRIEEKLLASSIHLKSGSFYFRMVELNTSFNKNPNGLNPSEADIQSDLNKLSTLVNKNFGISYP